MDAYVNLLSHYADDSGNIYYKIRELEVLAIVLKNMERVYEKEGNLKQTLNVVEKAEDGKSVIRWLEEGLTDAEAAAKGYTTGGRGWKHILEHRDDFKNKFGVSTEEEIQNLVMESINKGLRKEIPASKGGGFEYIYDIAGEKLKTIVGSNGYIVSSYPI